MPIISTKGAFSAQGYGFSGKTTTPIYVENVFSTYLYTGNGSTQTITNNIDLSTKGGLVWFKSRSGSLDQHTLFDTLRGMTYTAAYAIYTNATTQQENFGTNVVTANTDGFSLGSSSSSYSNVNQNSSTYVAWTFRKQPKFFDIVTYTGTGANRTIAHNLGSVPGMIIVKATSITSNWFVYHKGLTNSNYIIQLDTTFGQANDPSIFNGTAPTSTVFSIGNAADVNASGQSYVAYLFADQAGGFGLSGSDSVVACGSFTTDGSSNATVNLGWEPQFAIIKKSSGVANWLTLDNMRGMPASPATSAAVLKPNATDAEINNGSQGYINPTATGFTATIAASSTYIYLAIRRGPMKVPTSGTSVFSPITTTGAAGTALTTNFSVDMQWQNRLTGSADSTSTMTRLIGVSTVNNDTVNSPFLKTSATDAETSTLVTRYWNNTGYVIPFSFRSDDAVYYNFARAPGFMDVVCYTGTGVARTVAHNLGVAPELIIVKSRNRTGIYVSGWPVYSSSIGVSNALSLNETTPSQAVGTALWNSTAPTSSVFSLGTNDSVNAASNGNLYVAYLFATCPGVSKVGSYTGTGAAQNINCGFSAGARFVLIKRTDSTGDWYVYDSARGISSGSDPYLLLNSTAAQVTGTNYVDTFASGFALTATAPAGLNANGGSYIFLAIA